MAQVAVSDGKLHVNINVSIHAGIIAGVLAGMEGDWREIFVMTREEAF